MFDNKRLIIVDEFPKASFHVVFIQTFQRHVYQMVVTWNIHNVYKIMKIKRFVLSHVPTQVFQPHERNLKCSINAISKHMIL
jgi:hypothetical protein